MHISARLYGTLIAISVAFGANAQEFSVPEKPNKRELFARNAAANDRNPEGYLGINSTIIVPLDENSYAVLYGVLAGKRKGDSFHYFENPDVGFVCKGTGQPTENGGIITNECFLNGGSTGKRRIHVPSYGKISGTIVFPVFDHDEEVGLAAMQWGLTYPNYKSLYRTLKQHGG